MEQPVTEEIRCVRDARNTAPADRGDHAAATSSLASAFHAALNAVIEIQLLKLARNLV